MTRNDARERRPAMHALAERQVLLGARVRGLATLRIDCHGRVDLLFDARFDFRRLLCLLDFRSAASGR